MAINPELRAILEELASGQLENLDEHTTDLADLRVGQARMHSRIAVLETNVIQIKDQLVDFEERFITLEGQMKGLTDAVVQELSDHERRITRLEAQNDDADDSEAA